MSLSDLLKCPTPLIGERFNGSECVAEVIATMASVPEIKWNTAGGPAMFTSDTAFTKKLAHTIYECINLSNLIGRAIVQHRQQNNR